MVGKSEVAGGSPDFWSQFWTPLGNIGRQVADFFAPQSEASGSADAYEIAIELPGVADKDIHLSVHDRRLTVSGEKQASREETGKHYYFSERTYGAFQRSFQLPEDADAAGVKADHTDGLLTIRVPRNKPAGVEPKRIEING